MSQLGLGLGHELVIDLFAGGGGASLGMEQAMGRPVDIAVNHDPEAVAMHMANHPDTEHFCESVFKVHPVTVTRNQPVGLLWASPDCTHHSRAKGGKPVKSGRRGLAWVVVKWARRTRPRAIMLENVQEFRDWGPLDATGRPCQRRKGQQFDAWIAQLERLGYRVEYKLLRGCDYGAPTIRQRLFLVARRDGLPIVWPRPTHGPAGSPGVRRGRLQPYRTAAECIDWSIPCPSIFERKRPLAENTLRRIARGIQRFVIDAAEPFIVTCNHGRDQFRGQSIREPMRTVTAAYDANGVVAPFFIPRHGERAGQDPRCRHPALPMPTVTTTQNGAQLVAAFMAKHYGGNYTGSGNPVTAPLSTVTARDHNALVAALLAPYYGSGSGETGRDPRAPAPTIPTKDRLQLITVAIEGQQHVLVDIGMRMLEPRELFRAQGFPDSYVIDHGPRGRRLAKHAQVRMCGNSVCPPVARALVKANFAHERQEVAAA